MKSRKVITTKDSDCLEKAGRAADYIWHLLHKYNFGVKSVFIDGTAGEDVCLDIVLKARELSEIEEQELREYENAN